MSQAVVEETAIAAPSLNHLAKFFLKLGVVAFGGPAAHIAMMEDELVRRRHWVSSEDFLDLLAVSNLLPGPSSTELAIFIGYRLRGFAGLLLAGICFILPAFLIVGILAWAYVRYGGLPAVAGTGGHRDCAASFVAARKISRQDPYTGRDGSYGSRRVFSGGKSTSGAVRHGGSYRADIRDKAAADGQHNVRVFRHLNAGGRKLARDRWPSRDFSRLRKTRVHRLR